jgi:hypothetical protein
VEKKEIEVKKKENAELKALKAQLQDLLKTPMAPIGLSSRHSLPSLVRNQKVNGIDEFIDKRKRKRK